jgi:hypothetical protein
MPLPSEPQGFNLHSFRQLIGDPGRPYLFLVHIPHIGRDTVVTALARNAQLPAYTLQEVPIHFQGVQINIAGTPTFAQMDITFLSDEAQELRRLFMSWQSIAYDIGDGTQGHSNQYKSDQISIAQLSRNNQITAAYNLVGAFPLAVGAIDVSHENGTALEQFPVTIRYDYFVLSSERGDATNVQGMIRGNVVQIPRTPALDENGNFNPQ